MKKILLLVALASMFMTSCYEDKGSYDYTYVEAPDLQPIIDEVVFTSAQINVEYYIEVPVSTEYENTYDFHWEYVPDDEDADLIGKVCDGHDLQFTPRVIGDIEMYFVATHKEMQTEYYVSQTVTVAPVCSRGWLLLGVTGGESTLSFAEPASATSSTVAKTWTTYNNFITGLSSDANSLVMQYGEYKYSTGSNNTEDDVTVWVSSPTDAIAYSSESYAQVSTLAENRVGVESGDDIANWKSMIPMSTAAFLLEESGHIYMKYNPTMYGQYSDSPVTYYDEVFLAEMILYADYKYMPLSKYSGFFYLTAIGKDGSIKIIDVTSPTYSTTTATTGNVIDPTSVTGSDGSTLDSPNFAGADILGGVYYFISECEGNWYDAHRVNIILKEGSDYSMVSYYGYGYNGKLTDYQVISLDNSAGYLTGDKVELVAGSSNDGAFSYFASGKNLCIINTLGEIINIYSTTEDIAAIDVNPQVTEVGMALTNGELIILNVEDLGSPTIVHQMQYEVDSFVDLTYKYLSLDDAMDPSDD